MRSRPRSSPQSRGIMLSPIAFFMMPPILWPDVRLSESDVSVPRAAVRPRRRARGFAPRGRAHLGALGRAPPARSLADHSDRAWTARPRYVARHPSHLAVDEEVAW